MRLPAQKNILAFPPDAMRTVTRSLRLINAPLRENPEANRLFMEILTSNDAETVLRRMNETGVLGHFIPAFGKIVSRMAALYLIPPVNDPTSILPSLLPRTPGPPPSATPTIPTPRPHQGRPPDASN